ncbi:hypothetical protein JHD50_02275 [Sulfurimonas sp. MAG313]|nr:hypothetical protein [Sulfurimonas sp. MAG313]
MQREIKEKLEEVVSLLNDPEETVMDKEIKEKLEKILVLLNDPKEISMAKEELKQRLDKVVELVTKASVDPDIDIEYFNESDNPHILVTYVVSEYNKPTRKITLKDTVLSRNSPEDLANQITFAIEEFKGDIDSVGMG